MSRIIYNIRDTKVGSSVDNRYLGGTLYCVCPKEVSLMEIVLHQNSHGVSMVRQDFKLRSQVKVVTSYAGKRHCIRTYRFNRTEQAIDIPYCSWANLDCCGGWSCDEEYLDSAVQKGLKLFAGRVTSLKGQYTPNNPTVDEALREFEMLKNSLPSGVLADVETPAVDNGCLYTFICRTGCISDHIDLATVFESYDKLGCHLSEDDKKEITRLCGIEICQYGKDQAPFSYVHAAGVVQLVVTGLLLGYPIESTVSIIDGH